MVAPVPRPVETQGAGPRTRVVVIDDHPLFRKGVADLIGMTPDL